MSCTLACRAGGPAFVAGSGYSSGVEGQPLIWAGGAVQYFTDQGPLSPLMTGAQADAMVASAFGTWSGAPGIALSATSGGHLAEDVNGGNLTTDGSGNITGPADIVAAAVGTPVGIVYDYDGTVTDALLGQGAGGADDCFTNAVYGGPDNFSFTGSIVHALAVINGNCAATSAQLPDVQYRLVRVLGRIVGLGWSQANLNVVTGSPAPTAADYAGFPLMHFADPVSCVPISACYPNPAVPKMDDVVALAKLYPGGGGPAGRIFGTVYFTDAGGNAMQPMQGVNVVARLIGSGQPSRQYVATSVSGFLFHGDAGNIVDGYVDADGLRFDRWGSSDTLLEGFFDFGQLPIPTGQDIAQYQLSVEALDASWSLGVEPYGPSQVAPSGSFAPVVVTVTNGSSAERDILMLHSEVASAHPGSGSSYTSPAALPAGGGWGSWMAGYGSADWFEFTAQANRTASVSVTALDESGAATESKLQPVIGIWQLSDLSQNPAPASTPSAFNSRIFGESRLDAQFFATDTFRVGVADYRGDGRPDYYYRASLLYSDTVTPARLGLTGGPVRLDGTGFRGGLQVSFGGSSGSLLSVAANEIQALAPSAIQDGAADVEVKDPAKGAFSQMFGALTYGAAATDLLLLLQGSEPAATVGAQAATPIRVRAVAADGVTPVNGATIAWSSDNGLLFSVCGGANSCSALTDGAGESASWVTPESVGATTITVELAPQSYSPPQTKQATVVATSSALDLVAQNPTRWIAQGATLAVPLAVEALDFGAPKSGVTVNFGVVKGSAGLSAASATTGAVGVATITAQITNLMSEVDVTACVAPSNAPCQKFVLFSTSPSLWVLETLSGWNQVVANGQVFQPLVMRVTDGSQAENSVVGAPVSFATTLARVSPGPQGPPGGEGLGGGGGDVPVILGSSQALVDTDENGLASVVPSAANVGPCEVWIAVSAGHSTTQFELENLTAATGAPPHGPAPHGPTSTRFGGTPSEITSPAQVAIEVWAVPQAGSNSGPEPDPPAPAPDARSDEAVDPTSPADSIADVKPKPSIVSPLAQKKRSGRRAGASRGSRPAKSAIPIDPRSPPPSASNRQLFDDKRSCRALAGYRTPS